MEESCLTTSIHFPVLVAQVKGTAPQMLSEEDAVYGSEIILGAASSTKSETNGKYLILVDDPAAHLSKLNKYDDESPFFKLLLFSCPFYKAALNVISSGKGSPASGGGAVRQVESTNASKYMVLAVTQACIVE